MLYQLFQMFWFFIVIGCGFLALISFVCSVSFMKKKRYTVGLILALSELISAGISTSAWMWALKSSGKPTFLFGLTYFPLMGLICLSMFAVGAICIVINTWGMWTVKGERDNVI